MAFTEGATCFTLVRGSGKQRAPRAGGQPRVHSPAAHAGPVTSSLALLDIFDVESAAGCVVR